MLRVLGGLTLVGWAIFVSSTIFLVTGSGALTVLLTISGVAAMVAAFLPLNARGRHLLDVLLLAAVAVAFTFWVGASVHASPGYGTDEIAFDQAAASLAVHGHNPYTADLSSSLDEFAVPPDFFTFTLDGGHVSNLSYPAMAFLPYMPLLALGIAAQTAVYVNSAAWVVAMVLVWRLLPGAIRPVVPLLASLAVFTSFAIGGLTDPLFLPFLVVALWRWDRFGVPEERSAARWAGPIALGLAMGVKQSTWLLAPFLLAALAVEGHAAGRPWWRRPARYLSLLLPTFLIPNLPFLLTAPGPWLHGVVTPLADPLVPYGQAVVGLTTYLNTGGGNLTLYTAAGLAAVLALVGALVAWYPHLKRVIAALPAVALLFPSRSLVSYFVYVVPGLLVAALTVGRAHPVTPALRRKAMALAAAAMTLGAGLLVTAVITPAPLEIAVTGVHETAQLESFDELHLHVSNRAGARVTPHFAVSAVQFISSPWIVRRGPAALEPHASADFDIVSPNTASMASVRGGFEVYALTASPAAISASPPYVGADYHAQILPQAIERIIPAGEPVEIRVRVLDQIDSPVRRSGFQVALAQSVFAQEGGYVGQASINGAPEGRSPVTAPTDAEGVARFTIREIHAQPFQVFFQAWLVGDYPQGYSNTLGLRFSAGARGGTR